MSYQNNGDHRTSRNDRPISTRNKELRHSSKHNPCPVCGRTKDQDCSWTDDDEKVLCHTFAQEQAPQTANGYHFTGKYCDDGIHGRDSAAVYVKHLETRPGSSRPTRRVKPRKEKDRDAQLAAAEVETQVDHLAVMVTEGIETLEHALVTLSTWCKEHDHREYPASQLLKQKVKSASSQGNQTASDEAPRLLREYRLIEQHFADRLRFNTLFKQVELDGEVFEPSMAKLEMVVTHGLTLKGSREDIADIVVKLSKQNSYNPVVEYLDQVHERHGDDLTILDGLVKRHLGSDDTLHDILFMRFLVACVARAYAPGCKHDCALILQGPQGYLKSTFFRVLASSAWFDDSLGNASDKDERLKLHRAWMIEWAELETVFKRRDVSQVKAFLSCATDHVRPPYGRSIETMHRSSVIVGTTNENDFLIDSTGNRRFWIIPVKKPLDIHGLEQERDQIWAAAVALYRQGEPWHLSTSEEAAVSEERKNYEFHDTWTDKVAHYVNGKEWVSVTEVLIEAIDLELSRQDTKSIKRVTSILKRLGWRRTNNSRVYEGGRRKVWIPCQEFS